MNKENFLELIKTELNELQENLYNVSLKETTDKIEKLNDWLKMSIPFFNFNLEESPKKQVAIKEEEKEEHRTTTATEEKTEEPVDVEEETRWEDKALLIEVSRGYNVLDLNGNLRYRVPESIAREFDLTAGDYISLTKKENASATEFPYNIQTIGKKEDYKNPFERHNFLVLQRNPIGELVAKEVGKTYSIFNGHAFEWTVPESEVLRLQLKENDIVDVRVDTRNEKNKSIAWRHPRTDDYQTYKPVAKPTKRADKENRVKEKKDPLFIPGIKGKRVLLIGMSEKSAEFKEIVEYSGGEFDNYDSKTAKSQDMIPSIRKADLMVLSLSLTSHALTTNAIRFAKELNVPFANFTGFSSRLFAEAVLKAQEKNTFISY